MGKYPHFLMSPLILKEDIKSLALMGLIFRNCEMQEVVIKLLLWGQKRKTWREQLLQKCV